MPWLGTSPISSEETFRSGGFLTVKVSDEVQDNFSFQTIFSMIFSEIKVNRYFIYTFRCSVVKEDLFSVEDE